MNVLKHPVVVGLLALVAVAFVAQQLLHLKWLPKSALAGVRAPGVNPLVPPAGGTEAGQPDPATAIDRSFAEAHMSGWLEAPQRDPFWQAKPTLAPALTNSPVHFTLEAIWQQDGVSEAAINHGIVRPGDSVEGCLVDSIEDDGVWLVNNGQRGFLRFAGDNPANPAR
jgi:hypothetical protein